MIYYYFLISFISYLTLKLIQFYCEYFIIQVSPKSENEKPIYNKIPFPKAPKILFSNLFKSRRPDWKLCSVKTKRILSIVKGISHFLGIFSSIALVYCIFQYWLDNTTNINKAAATIYSIENIEAKIEKYIKYFEITSIYQIAIIFILIALASTWPLIEHFKLRNKFKKFNKLVRNILYFLTISTSFTFFGNTSYAKEKKVLEVLEIHKLSINEKNELLQKDINEAVTEIVVKEILSEPSYKGTLDKIEEIKQKIQDVTSSKEYQLLSKSILADNIMHLAISKFAVDINKKYDFAYYFESVEYEFKNAYHKNSSSNQTDYYTAKQKLNYSRLKANNKNWFDEKNISENSIKNAENVFTNARQKVPSKYSNYYSRYKEAIDKLIKKGYSSTGKKWIKDFFTLIGVDFPFISEFINPIINEPIEDFLTKKTETIFKESFQGNEKAVEVELNKCAEEFKKSFSPSVKSNSKFKTLESSIERDLYLSNTVALQTKNEINRQLTTIDVHYKRIDDHLKMMCSNSRWEVIRIGFAKKLQNIACLLPFNDDQIEIFEEVLNDWDKYKIENKTNWYESNKYNIEEIFIEYLKDKPKVKACWGYILKIEDEKGAIEYYSSINENPKSGQDVFLNYYFNKVDKTIQHDQIYDYETGKWLGFMCPFQNKNK